MDDGDEVDIGVMSDEVEVDEMADKELASCWRDSWGPAADGPSSPSDERPITSSTMPPKPIWLFCFNVGSTNPGGGHISSLNIDPVSDVRDFIKLILAEEPSGSKTGVE